jgi:hypothetical protein
MKAKHVVLAMLATGALAAPATASAATVSVNQECFAENDDITLTGSGFTPNTTVTLTLDGTTSAVDSDATGAFVTTLTAPELALKHPGAQQVTISVRDTTSGEELATSVNVAKTGVDAFPTRSRPHKRITWYITGFVGSAVYGHWRFKGRTRADHRMGVPKGPCGVLKVKARQIEASRVRFGLWTIQFDFNKHYKPNASPRTAVTVNVFPTFR